MHQHLTWRHTASLADQTGSPAAAVHSRSTAPATRRSFIQTDIRDHARARLRCIAHWQGTCSPGVSSWCKHHVAYSLLHRCDVVKKSLRRDFVGPDHSSSSSSGDMSPSWRNIASYASSTRVTCSTMLGLSSLSPAARGTCERKTYRFSSSRKCSTGSAPS